MKPTSRQPISSIFIKIILGLVSVEAFFPPVEHVTNGINVKIIVPFRIRGLDYNLSPLLIRRFRSNIYDFLLHFH